MRLRKEASLGISTMLGLQIVLSVLAITLLERMGPAIERIIEENVYSIAAAEEMLAELVLRTGSEGDTVPENFVEALARARANVTEAAEPPLLDLIGERQAAAFAGDAMARAEVVAALRELGKVNRDSMIEADEKAKRLSQTGAWGAALLGAFALILGVMVYRQLRLRLEVPIDHLHRTTERIRAGNLQARCANTAGPLEVQRISTDINWLLDRIALAETKEKDSDDHERNLNVRQTLAWFLEQRDFPAMVLDGEGHKVACNTKALEVDAAFLDTLTEDQGHMIEIDKTPFRYIEIQEKPPESEA